MSQYENEDCFPYSPDELKAVFPQTTPTPSLSQGSPSVSPPDPALENRIKRPIGSSTGQAVLLRNMGVPIELTEKPLQPSDALFKFLGSDKEAVARPSHFVSFSPRRRQDIWRKDTRHSSQDPKVFSSTSIPSQKSIFTPAASTNTDTSLTLHHEEKQSSGDFLSHSAHKTPLSMAHNKLSSDNRLPPISQLDQIVRSGISSGMNASYEGLNYSSSTVPSLQYKISKATCPPQLPSIFSFPNRESSSTPDSGFSLSEKYTKSPSFSSMSVYEPKPPHSDGHSLQAFDGIQPLTPSFGSVHSGSDSYSGTDGYSPDNLPSPAESTRTSNHFTRETNLSRIRNQNESSSRLASPSGRGFKCTSAGCILPPFQTQYLLKCISLALV